MAANNTPSSFFNLSPNLSRLLKSSHRTVPEQTIGLLIYLFISFSFERLTHWVGSQPNEWFSGLAPISWALTNWPLSPLWAVYHLLLPLSMWTIWRRYSLRILKLELSCFLSLFLFGSIWNLSLFYFREPLLSLIALLLLFSNLLLALLLFWKKDPLSGQILAAPLFWILYTIGINMTICILNP